MQAEAAGAKHRRNKKTLQERLALHMDSTACAKHSAPSAAADLLAGRNMAGPSSKGVFKAQKRKNFVRINLKVSSPLGEDVTRPRKSARAIGDQGL